MNFFALLLSFYMLTLSCFACGDGAGSMQKERQESTSTSCGHHQQQDNCPPLCGCACCFSTAICPATAHPKPIILTTEHVRFFAQQDYVESYNAHVVWQPPRA